MDALKIAAKAQQIGLRVLLALLALMALAQLVGPAQAATNQVPYDAVKRQQLETVTRLYFETRVCMYRASKIMLRISVLDREAIKRFTIGQCSVGLRGYLTRPMGWEERDITRLLNTIADLELDSASFTL